MQQDCMRRRFDREPCSIARSLEILGDWWTLLIVRDAFLGVRRFVDFQARLGISKNILTRRLGHLTAHGVLAAVDAGVHGPRYEYELTAKGKDLFTAITVLRQWGDRWVFGAGHEPLPLRGDAALLAVLLRNLLDNALRYAPQGSTVTLRFDERSLEVENDAEPLGDEQLARLGERFYRPDGQEEIGSGLGLSIVRRIAALHGLGLHFERRAGGRGLRVRVGA